MVCNGCMAYLNEQDHIAICGDCVGTCGSCDRSWSEEVDGGEETEGWFANHTAWSTAARTTNS